MLGLSWGELMIIGVVALIFIGPKDLPVMMRRVGQVVGTIRRMGSEFQRELNKTTGLDEVKSLRNSITAPLRQTTEEIRREFNAIGKDGSVKPSGVMKPADPKTESVVDQIKAQAGMTAEKPAATPAATAEPAKPAAARKAPVKAAKAPIAKPVADSKVTSAPLADITPAAEPNVVTPSEPAKKGPARKTAAQAPASPAKVKATTTRAAKAKPAAVETPAAEPAVLTPAEPVKKGAARKTAAAKPATEKAPAAAKPRTRKPAIKKTPEGEADKA